MEADPGRLGLAWLVWSRVENRGVASQPWMAGSEAVRGPCMLSRQLIHSYNLELLIWEN